MQFNLYTVILVFFFLLSVCAGHYTHKQKDSMENNYLFMLTFCGAVWIFFGIMESISVSLSAKIYFSQFKYVAITTSPVLVLLFILNFTHKLSRFKQHHFFLLFLVPTITTIGVFTNPIHHLHSTDARLIHQSFSGITLVFSHGLNYWIIISYSFAILTFGFFVLLKTGVRYPKRYAYQIIILMTSFFLPVGVYVVYLLAGDKSMRIDIIPLTFTVSGFILLAGMKHYGLLEVKPLDIDLLFNSMQDGVLFLDASDQIIDLNKSATEILNVRFKNDSPERDKRAINQYPEFYQFYKTSGDSPMEFRLSEESNEYYEVIEHDLVGKRDEIYGKVIVLRNISEQKASKMSIETQNDELVKLVQQNDKMFSIVTHDLRSPFSSIIGLAEIMNVNYDGISDEKRKSYISQFLNRTKMTYDLIENLLQWTKSRNNGFVNNFSEIDLKNLIGSTVKFYQSMAADKQIRLTITDNTDIQPQISGNDQLVRTIVRNLITNAIKFTPEKGEVAVSYEYLSNHYQVCIADSGIGIPAEKLQTMLNFEKTFHTLGTKREGGSGLGLSLCYEFVNKMGGKLWIISDVGIGTTIFFNLPYAINL